MISVSNQAYVFFVFILVGFIIGILFDIFRVLRRTFKTTDFITYIEDILFWILSGIIVLYAIFKFNNGDIRGYIIIGILIGSSIYLMVFSKTFIKFSVNIINFIKRVILQTLKIITYPLKKILRIFIKPVNFIFINISKTAKNLLRKILSKISINNIIKEILGKKLKKKKKYKIKAGFSYKNVE